MRTLISLLAVTAVLGGCNADLTRLCDFCEVKGEHGGQVNVRAIRRHHSSAGVTEVPEDLSRENLGLLMGEELSVPVDGGRGAPFSAPQQGAGVFTEVEDGVYLLRWESDFIASTARDVDLSYDVLGRADVDVAESGVTLSIGADGGVPAGEYQLISPNSGYFAFGLEQAAANGSGPLQFNYASAFGRPAPLIDASKGDVAWLTQHDRGTLASGAKFTALRRSGQLSPFTASGNSLTTTTALEPLPLQSFTFDWDHASFEAVRTQVHPSAQLGNAALFFDVVPFGEDAGVYGSTPDLITLSAKPGEALSGTITYGNPFPRDWPAVAFVVQNYSVSQQFGGASLNTGARIVMASLQKGGRFEAAISPPRALRVEGGEANQSVTAERDLIIVSWAPPSLGVPTYYTVEVVGGSGNALARFYTSGTRMVLPKELFAPGIYVFRVRAVSDPAANAEREPFRTSLPTAVAEAVSGIVQVK